MKAISNLALVFFIVGVLCACHKLDLLPSNQLTNEVVKNSPEMLGSITMGTYARLTGQYAKHYIYINELPSDDAIWVKSSGSNFQNIYSYKHIANNSRADFYWKQSYYGIYSTNVVIEAIADTTSDPHLLQLKGENLFLRAFFNYNLLRSFSMPYHQNPEKKLGVPIMDSTDVFGHPKRSTVKKCYSFVVSDLLKAAGLMTEDKSNIYASKEVAWALLARIYLAMEENEKAIKYADSVIKSGRYSLVPTNKLADYFSILPESNPETIFAIKFTADQNMGKGSIGSLYTKDGWAEIPVSPSYLNLVYKNPNDERIKFIEPVYVLDDNGNKIPDPTDKWSGYKVEKRNGYAKYFNIKYTYQNGIPLLSSPVILRLAEMYMIKAEAFAKLGENKEAIDLVNRIRKRAGLKGNQLYTVNDLKGHASVLDVVLEEDRLEFAWEGHRFHDLIRNNKPIDRSYNPPVGWAGPAIVQPTSHSIVLLIPEDEIALNPNLVQNPN